MFWLWVWNREKNDCVIVALFDNEADAYSDLAIEMVERWQDQVYTVNGKEYWFYDSDHLCHDIAGYVSPVFH